MTGLDWAIVAVVVLSVLLAAAQGFFFEVFALAGVVLGYLLAAWEYWRVSSWILPHVQSQAVADGVAFLAIFFGVMLAAGITGRIARWLVRQAGLGLADRFLGAIFGLARGLAIVTVLILALAAFAPGSRWLAQSSLAGHFLGAAQGMSWVAPASLREKLRHGVAAIRQAAEPARKPPPGRN
jgi:membrane protein required for colicin V production